MKRSIAILFFSLVILLPQKSQGDFWGGDLVYLAQILENAIQQLVALEKIIGTGKDQLDFLREIHKGINDSMNLMRQIAPYLDPGTYKDLRSVAAASERFKTIYGAAVDSPETQVQTDTDQIIAENITMNNSMFDYAKELDEIAERIKSFSHEVSPGGAQKLTAQSLAVLVQIQNQQMRAQAQALKTQAQVMAAQNKKDKDQTRNYLTQAQVLQSALKSTDFNCEFPRF